ncbi:hypothetical protein [Azospirillum endophyticum]
MLLDSLIAVALAILATDAMGEAYRFPCCACSVRDCSRRCAKRR